MKELFAALFGNGGLPIRQRDFVKSFCFAFPVVYNELVLTSPGFVAYDILTRCMVVSSKTLFMLFFVVALLCSSHRFRKKRRMRTGIGYYVLPVLAHFILVTRTGFAEVFGGWRAVLTSGMATTGLVVLYDAIMGFCEKADRSKEKYKHIFKLI